MRNAVLIRGTAGAPPPVLMAMCRVLTVVNSCRLEGVCLRGGPQGQGAGVTWHATVLVANTYRPGINCDVHVSMQSCSLETEHPRVPALVVRTQNGALGARTTVELRDCALDGDVYAINGVRCALDGCQQARGMRVNVQDDAAQEGEE